MEKLVKPLWVNLFSAGFSLLEPLWGTQCEDHASGVGRDGGAGRDGADAGGEIVGRGILFRWDHGRVPLRQNFLKCNLIFGYRFFTYFPDIDQNWFWNYFRGHRSSQFSFWKWCVFGLRNQIIYDLKLKRTSAGKVWTFWKGHKNLKLKRAWFDIYLFQILWLS